MKFRLRSYDTSPPGGYFFQQFGSKPRNFASQPLIEAQAKSVMAYRKGNGLERATLHECIEDVDQYNARRLGNNPQYCIAVSEDQPNAIALSENTPGFVPCNGCGAPVSA